jgi:hypothetical protein
VHAPPARYAQCTRRMSVMSRARSYVPLLLGARRFDRQKGGSKFLLSPLVSPSYPPSFLLSPFVSPSYPHSLSPSLPPPPSSSLSLPPFPPLFHRPQVLCPILQRPKVKSRLIVLNLWCATIVCVRARVRVRACVRRRAVCASVRARAVQCGVRVPRTPRTRHATASSLLSSHSSVYVRTCLRVRARPCVRGRP